MLFVFSLSLSHTDHASNMWEDRHAILIYLGRYLLVYVMQDSSYLPPQLVPTYLPCCYVPFKKKLYFKLNLTKRHQFQVLNNHRNKEMRQFLREQLLQHGLMLLTNAVRTSIGGGERASWRKAFFRRVYSQIFLYNVMYVVNNKNSYSKSSISGVK